MRATSGIDALDTAQDVIGAAVTLIGGALTPANVGRWPELTGPSLTSDLVWSTVS